MRTFDEICDIIRNFLELGENFVITENSTFLDVNADSLDTVEIIMEIEDRFGIEIPDGFEEKIHNVGDLVRTVDELI